MENFLEGKGLEVSFPRTHFWVWKGAIFNRAFLPKRKRADFFRNPVGPEVFGWRHLGPLFSYLVWPVLGEFGLLPPRVPLPFGEGGDTPKGVWGGKLGGSLQGVLGSIFFTACGAADLSRAFVGV